MPEPDTFFPYDWKTAIVLPAGHADDESDTKLKFVDESPADPLSRGGGSTSIEVAEFGAYSGEQGAHTRALNLRAIGSNSGLTGSLKRGAKLVLETLFLGGSTGNRQARLTLNSAGSIIAESAVQSGSYLATILGALGISNFAQVADSAGNPVLRKSYGPFRASITGLTVVPMTFPQFTINHGLGLSNSYRVRILSVVDAGASCNPIYVFSYIDGNQFRITAANPYNFNCNNVTFDYEVLEYV